MKQNRFTAFDFLSCAAALIFCFVFFYHDDIYGVGWDSLNYIYGSFGDFYENCKKIRGGGISMDATPYPPSIYLIFSAWLYPMKHVGALTSADHFPAHLTYWLKALTTLVYVFGAMMIHKITMKLSNRRDVARYCTMAWALSPLAVFSQFIFSQYDIFYVALTMTGVYCFLNGKTRIAALAFGFSITFKYFPAFTFIPLLLLLEKRFLHQVVALAIFLTPTAISNFAYKNSVAFAEGVKKHGAIERIFSMHITTGGWEIYLLIASFVLLCAYCYVKDVEEENCSGAILWVWMTSSILPFVFVLWHPQWLLAITPAIVLTNACSRQNSRFGVLDAFASVMFIGTVTLGFTNNVDAAMFKGDLLGLDLENSYLMGNFFNKLPPHSQFIYLSCFWAYLLAQPLLKLELIQSKATIEHPTLNWQPDFSAVRISFWVGLLAFMIPLAHAVHKDIRRHETMIFKNGLSATVGEITAGKVFSQRFVAKTSAPISVGIMLGTFNRTNSSELILTIIDHESGSVLTSTKSNANQVQDNQYKNFGLKGIRLVTGREYEIQVTSPDASSGNAVTWWQAPYDSANEAAASIDGVPQRRDFAFKVVFQR